MFVLATSGYQFADNLTVGSEPSISVRCMSDYQLNATCGVISALARSGYQLRTISDFNLSQHFRQVGPAPAIQTGIVLYPKRAVCSFEFRKGPRTVSRSVFLARFRALPGTFMRTFRPSEALSGPSGHFHFGKKIFRIPRATRTVSGSQLSVLRPVWAVYLHLLFTRLWLHFPSPSSRGVSRTASREVVTV